MLLRPLPLLVLALVLTACDSSEPPSAADERKPVRVLVAGTETAAAHIRATGLVASQEEARLGFKTGGVITAMLVDAGDRVQRGQTLARLDATELEGAVRQAAAHQERAARDVSRAEKLYEQGVIAEQQVQDARTQLAVLNATLASAHFNRQQATITAPGPGIVLQRLAEAREVVAPGAPVLVVSRDDLGWTLKAGLGEQTATRIRVGDPAEIVLKAYPERRLTSRVQDIAGATDRQTGTVSITLPLPASAGVQYRAGLVGEAILRPTPVRGEQLSLPLGALLEADGRQARIFVIGPRQTASLRTVTLGNINADRVVILAGLKAGERVVSEGAAWLNAGDHVRILR